MALASDLNKLAELAARFAALAPDKRRVFLEKLTAIGVDFASLPIPRLPITAGLKTPVLRRASYAQQRMWHAWRMEPGGAQYTMSADLRMQGKLDAVALHAAVSMLIQRHPILRTRYSEDESGELWQIADHPDSVALDWREIVCSSEADVHAQLKIIEPFDLGHGQVLRVRLFKLDEQDFVLSLRLHHIAGDAWSLGLIGRELNELYRGADDTGKAKTDAIEYADFSEWQRNWLEAGEGDRQLAWWRAVLGNNTPVQMTLPGERAGQGDLGPARRHYFLFDAELNRRLRDLARAQGCSLFELLAASLTALLYRYGNRDGLGIGVPVANRDRPELQNIFGLLVNTFVLRAKPNGRESFVQVLHDTGKRLRGAQAHSDLPYEKIAHALGEGAAFRVMYSHASAATLPNFPDLSVLPFASAVEVPAQCDLIFGTEETAEGGLRGGLVYAGNRLDAAGIARIALHWQTLLADIAARPNAAIDELSVLSDGERRALRNWQPRLLPQPFISLPQLITARARQQPHAMALIGTNKKLSGANQTLSYAELDRASRALAMHLRTLGVGPETRVAVCLSRSPSLFVALLAILRAGAAYVPLDPAFPAERLVFLQRDAGVELLITEAQLSAQVPNVDGVHKIHIDELAFPNEAPDEVNALDFEIHPEQLAYLIYTSGSTGTPKGVAVSHAALSSHMQAIAKLYGMNAADRLLHFISVSFDGAGEAWLAPLLSGATVVIGDPATWTPDDINAALIDEQISIVGLSPAVLLHMAEAWREAGRAGVPPVRSYTVGGEAISREAFARIREIFKPPRLFNGYGPTETVVTPLLWQWYPTTANSEWDSAAYLPIGSPVGQRSAYVLDADLNEVAVGVAGELFLGGLLARGYHDRPALTAERFIPNPFNKNSAIGERLYRTGDRVVRRVDGGFDYLGRADQQIKLRGLRIEPGEIESRLLQIDGVREAVVAVIERHGQAQLVAYIGGDTHAEAIKNQLHNELPDYLIPSAFAIVKALPRLPSGKLDRQHLPEPEWSKSVYVAPEGEIEIQIATIWAELLSIAPDTIGRFDHFFALGGHSLLAARVVARLRVLFGHNIPLRSLFTAPRLNDFAAALQTGAAAAIVPQHSREHNLPLSPQQHELFDWQRAHPHCAAYHISGGLHLRGALDSAALEASFAKLIERHESLRTVYSAADEQSGRQVAEQKIPRQKIKALVPFQLQQIDFSNTVEIERDTALSEWARAVAEQPFDLAAPPLLRAALAKLGANDYALVIVVHHIAADGMSMDILLAEMMRAYVAYAAGDEPVLPPLSMQYADLAVWQSERSHTELLASAVAKFATAALERERQSTPRPTQFSHRGARIRFAVPSATTCALRDLARARATTMAALCFAAFNAVIAVRNEQTDIVTGMPVSLRDGAGQDDLVGLLINYVPLRVQLDFAAPLHTLVDIASAAFTDAQARTDLPLAALINGLGIAPRSDRHPLFQHLFNYLRPRYGALTTLPGIDVAALPIPLHTVLFDIEFDVSEYENGELSVGLGYCTDIYAASVAEQLRDSWLALLEHLVCDISQPLDVALNSRCAQSSS